MLGAPLLAATAALRAGAGLVQIATHHTLLGLALSHTPELVGHALSRNSDRQLLRDAEKADVLVIGPGMGLDATATRRLGALLKLGLPTLIDADGLTLLAKMKKAYRHQAGLTLTPHPGEMSRLGRHFGKTGIESSEAGRIETASACAEVFGAVVVLKGARTVVSDGNRVFVNPVSTTALSKAGTGDVLAGLAGTLMAQMNDAFDAARLAVHLHAQAGLLAEQELGARSVLASDVLRHLPHALKR